MLRMAYVVFFEQTVLRVGLSFACMGEMVRSIAPYLWSVPLYWLRLDGGLIFGAGDS